VITGNSNQINKQTLIQYLKLILVYMKEFKNKYSNIYKYTEYSIEIKRSVIAKRPVDKWHIYNFFLWIFCKKIKEE